ncbi:MAG: penicillin-binding protein 2 [Planctomycetota bacterium]|nr:penicillin-binding protein 2 [Planctomycetota bacterium]
MDQGTPLPQGPSSPPPAQTCRAWRKGDGAGPKVRLRIGLILSLVLLAYGGLCARLVQVQVTQGPAWRARAANQKVARELVAAQRGFITDRQRLPLAYCEPRDVVIADLLILKDPNAAADALAPLLHVPATQLRDKMSHDDRRVVYLARDVEDATADAIRALKIRGIGFEDSFRRTYPQRSLACHVLGWSGVDGGMEGLELSLNSLLSGTPGFLRYYRDAARRLIALNDGATGPADTKPARDGLAVVTTIDARIQEVAEDEIAHILELYQPKSATCIVMDVSNGAILAMACAPQFDPNLPAKAPADSRRNRAVTDMYEPGSTFKTFIAAMALEKKVWRRNETINCENGAWHLGYRTLHDAHAYGLLLFDEVIIKSSNIGAAKIATRLGVSGVYELVRAFGFGEKTGVNLPGEDNGKVRSRKLWTDDSIKSVGMGHEIGVTPLQLATAYAAVVNGGILYRPKIVQRIINEKGEELYTLHPQPVRRVISEQTSQQMREILTRVVGPGGTGFRAFCPEWPIGGKTGTTKKIDPATKTYSSTMYIGSFCGFAPADNPRLVCLVTVDEPHKSAGYYGATVACPAVREVLRKGMTVLNIPPRSADEQKKVVAEVKKLAAR